jgi:hypothetical protein
MFLMQYGKTYRTYERRPLALAYCVDDPMNDPHFYRLRDGRWELDIVAEVRNTQNLVDSPYTWRWRGSNDDFSRVFADKLLPMADGHVRVVGGDNRLLPTREPAQR